MPIDYDGWGGQGYRGGLIICTHTGYGGGGATLNGFDSDLAVNGDKSNNATGSWAFPLQVLDGGHTLVFNFRAPVVVKKMRWVQDVSGNDGNQQFQGSNDGAAWTNIGSAFALGGAASQEFDFSANVTAYQYYRLQATGGAAIPGPWQQETEFATDHGAYEAGWRAAWLGVSLAGLSIAGGIANNLVNGSTSSDDENTFRLTNAQPVSGLTTITVSLDTEVELRAAALMCLGGSGNNGVWQPQVQVSGAWQNFGAAFTMSAYTAPPGNGTHVFIAPPVTTKWFRLLGVSGVTNDTIRLNEIFFMTGPPGAVPVPPLNLAASFADDGRFLTSLFIGSSIPPANLAASFADDGGFNAEVFVGTSLKASFKDDGGFNANMTFVAAPLSLAVTFTDETQFLVREANEPLSAYVNSFVIVSGL